MKVLLASADDAHDPGAWSGTAYQARVALEAAGHEVVVVTGLPTTRLVWHLALRALRGAGSYPLWMTGSTLRGLARRLRRAELRATPDVVLSISSQYLAKAALVTPVVMFSDAPWQSFRERYGAFQPFPKAARRYERLEAAAARRATALVYSSEWAKSEAERLFGVDESRITVVPLGANWTPSMAAGPSLPEAGRVRMLFVGRDWRRKGGDIAVAVLHHLRQTGLDATLTVVGVLPGSTDGADAAEGVTVIGRTGILDERGTTSMRRLYEECDVVLVPSRAECFGIVYAEAAAFGKPAIALDVDAVGEVVLHDRTGLVMPEHAPADEIARAIASLLRDRDRYSAMSLHALERSREVLNWGAFGRGLTAVLEASASC